MIWCGIIWRGVFHVEHGFRLGPVSIVVHTSLNPDAHAPLRPAKLSAVPASSTMLFDDHQRQSPGIAFSVRCFYS